MSLWPGRLRALHLGPWRWLAAGWLRGPDVTLAQAFLMFCTVTGHNMTCNRAEYQVTTQEFLSRYAVFSLDWAREHLPGDARQRLQHAVETGKAVSLRRGLYASVPPGTEPGQFVPDRYLVLSQARPDVVLAGHSALELLGLAHSEWSVCSGYSSGRRKNFSVGSVKYSVVVPPASLLTAGLCDLGVTTASRGGLKIRHLGVERCLADGFDRPRLFGGVVELVESLDGARLINLDLVERIMAGYDSRTLYGAAGWFLERNRVELFVPEPFLRKLEKLRPASPHYLDRRTGNAVLVHRWNVLVPRELVRGESRDA